ncbi:hypothetical protein OIE13_05890 [Streptosporangium sp. NBC_01810]|uniref:hypothetical protein n=1 Tax=Streptosporangium sp. NBC_01810 TaxID=2975951 RepID=UPI002DD98822|nr:hypothetical protein [Streptosporangium sp. NBC_01810]WSA27404.1 hypothetical protein OIE13_05890 [Streptosporangium sp. NBC_01810]
MFQIRDERGNVLDERPTFEAAEERLEEICRQATEQAAANAEGVNEMTLRWTIVDTAGREVGWMSLTPDTTRPYEPISQAQPDDDQGPA